MIEVCMYEEGLPRYVRVQESTMIEVCVGGGLPPNVRVQESTMIEVCVGGGLTSLPNHVKYKHQPW